MKKNSFFKSFLAIFILSLVLAANVSLAKKIPDPNLSGEEIIKILENNNKVFQQSLQNNADISLNKRIVTATDGQKPYAAVVACADSRVPPEHVFLAGIGELFVIRNAGNVIGNHELGSIEYAVNTLGVKLVIILGHTHCGAVGAALDIDKYIGQYSQLYDVIHDISRAVSKENDPRAAEIKNVEHSIQNILDYPILKKALKEKNVLLRGALYSIKTGKVEFLTPKE